MKFIAEINVMSVNAQLDPQARATMYSLHEIGFNSVENVRVGRHITIEIEADNKKSAEEKVDKACKNILSKPIIEKYEFTLIELN